GTTVHASVGATIGVGQKALYQIAAPVSGSLEVDLTPGAGALGHFIVQILTADSRGNVTVLASGAPGATHVNVDVQQGDVLLVQVSGDAQGQGNFTLDLTNLDQLETTLNQTMLFPAGGKPASVVEADLNRDGKPDLVVTSSNSDQISVLLGNGDGTF